MVNFDKFTRSSNGEIMNLNEKANETIESVPNWDRVAPLDAAIKVTVSWKNPIGIP